MVTMPAVPVTAVTGMTTVTVVTGVVVGTVMALSGRGIGVVMSGVIEHRLVVLNLAVVVLIGGRVTGVFSRGVLVHDATLYPWGVCVEGVWEVRLSSPGVVREVKARSRRLLLTTNTLDNAMAAPASMGLSSPSAASGIAATL